MNRVSDMIYPRLKELIEMSLNVKVLGYVPEVSDCQIESRHLGLVTPDEIKNLNYKLEKLANILEKTIDMDALIQIAKQAEDFRFGEPKLTSYRTKLRLGIARDEAFCFYYSDNLELLEKFGAELIYFSPIHDEKIPDNLSGLIFYGGYPELYARELSENDCMIQSIREAFRSGVPYLAECGGFMYLHESMEDFDGNRFPMVGEIPAVAYQTKRLGRFGYIEMETEKECVFGQNGFVCRGHEFHYFDSTDCGQDVHAKKPFSNRSWECIHGNRMRMAGFPHFYYYSNPQMIVEFLKMCENKSKDYCNENRGVKNED